MQMTFTSEVKLKVLQMEQLHNHLIILLMLIFLRLPQVEQANGLIKLPNPQQF